MGRVAWVVGVLAVALTPLAAGQGLGDAAKKEKGRLAQGQKSSAPPKSFTQEDLRAGAPDASSPAEAAADDAQAKAGAPASSPARTQGAAADSEAESRKRDEERWRGRVVDARARIETARKKHQAMASLTLVPGYEYVDETGRIVIHDVEHLQSLTARAKAALEASERALEDLFEEARRAGVPPGWLR